MCLRLTHAIMELEERRLGKHVHATLVMRTQIVELANLPTIGEKPQIVHVYTVTAAQTVPLLMGNAKMVLP